MSNTINATLRTATAIAAIIDGINAASEQSGTPVNGGELRLLELEARAATAVEKFEKAKADYEARAAVAAIESGDDVTILVGRGKTKRIENGRVLFVSDEGGNLQFNVLTGYGIKSKTQLVGPSSLLMTDADVARAEQEIAEAQAGGEGGEGEGSAE